MGRIISFANQKGGCAKTTTVQNVGAGLAKLGRKVCLVDLDPQADLTEGMGVVSDDLELSVYNFLLEGAPFDSVVKNIKENLWLIPSNIELAGAEVALATLAGKDGRLRKVLEQAKDFDYIIIDNPPALGQLTLNGLTAATEVMVPLQTEFYSYKALKKLLETIETVKQYTNPSLYVSGIVCTFYRDQRTLNKNVAEQLTSHFGAKVFKTKISDNIKLAEAPSAGLDIFSYFPNCQGAWDYKNLCDEIDAMEVI